MKLRNLFNKNEDEDSENLLDFSDNEEEFDTFKPRSFRMERKVDDKRSRMTRSASMRVGSTRSPPKRSKSEVGKRLKALEDDFGGTRKNKKKGGSKSVGGTFKGTSSQVRSRIDHLALERSGSDRDVQSSSLDSLFTKSEHSPQKKKLRGGKRSSFGGGDSVAKKEEKEKSQRGERSTPGRSRSMRSQRTVGGDKERSRSKSKGRSKSRTRSSSKKRSSSKPRRASSKMQMLDDTNRTEDSDVKKKKKSDKEKKKKKSKDGEVSTDDSSLPSKVEMNENASQTSSLNDSSSHTKKKKSKEKEKEKAPKKSKRQSKSFPDLPPDEFGDGLEGLAEEFRRSKAGSKGGSTVGSNSSSKKSIVDPPSPVVPPNFISKEESVCSVL